MCIKVSPHGPGNPCGGPLGLRGVTGLPLWRGAGWCGLVVCFGDAA
jgi:hypothetical protein